jgi:hypothetical protein
MRSSPFVHAILSILSSGFLFETAIAAEPTTRPTNLSTQQLLEKIDTMQGEIDQLKSQVRQQQHDPAEGSRIMDQIHADAVKHSDMMSSIGLNAGYANRRFFIQSEDGNFVLRPWIHLQLRYSTSIRDDFFPDGSSNTQSGFEVRRARLGFDGVLFTPDLSYLVNWATNRENSTLTVTNSAGQVIGTTTSPVGGEPVLEEAWVKYNLHDTPWFIHVGQMHDPLDHENMVGSKYRAPEASLQGDIFGNTDTFTQAATVQYAGTNKPIRFEGGVTDGIRAANTNFEDSPNNGIAYDGGVAGRIEWKLMGNWKDYDQLTAWGNSANLLVLGTGLDYSYAGGGDNTISQTLDLQYGGTNGFFAYICYFGRYTEHNRGIPNTSSVSASFVTPTPQLGKDTYEPSVDAEFAYLIGKHFEPFVRYEYMFLQGTPPGSQNDVTDISLGFNYYFFGHNVMFTQQFMYLPTGIPINDDSSDVLISNGKAEFIFISQLQLLI